MNIIHSIKAVSLSKVTKKTITDAKILMSARTDHTNVEALQTVFAITLPQATVVSVNWGFHRMAVQKTQSALTKTSVN